MKKLIIAIFAGCMGLASVAAFAQDTMKKDGMMNKDGTAMDGRKENAVDKDVMTKSHAKKHKKMMKKDGMAKDKMSKDKMMNKDEMGKDKTMDKDGMGKDEMTK